MPSWLPAVIRRELVDKYLRGKVRLHLQIYVKCDNAQIYFLRFLERKMQFPAFCKCRQGAQGRIGRAALKKYALCADLRRGHKT